MKPNIYVGTLLDFNYNYTKSLADWMKTNPAILKYGNRYHNIGIGALFQYDTRDDVATPFEGVFLSQWEPCTGNIWAEITIMKCWNWNTANSVRSSNAGARWPGRQNPDRYG